MSGFLDIAECPQKHRFAIFRMGKSAGKIVATYCSQCRKMFKAQVDKPNAEDKRK